VQRRGFFWLRSHLTLFALRPRAALAAVVRHARRAAGLRSGGEADPPPSPGAGAAGSGAAVGLFVRKVVGDAKRGEAPALAWDLYWSAARSVLEGKEAALLGRRRDTSEGHVGAAGTPKGNARGSGTRPAPHPKKRVVFAASSSAAALEHVARRAADAPRLNARVAWTTGHHRDASPRGQLEDIRDGLLEPTTEAMISVANLFLLAESGAFVGTSTSNFARVVAELRTAWADEPGRGGEGSGPGSLPFRFLDDDARFWRGVDWHGWRRLKLLRLGEKRWSPRLSGYE
jgi:hypothetical protein